MCVCVLCLVFLSCQDPTGGELSLKKRDDRRNPGGVAILTCKSCDIFGESGERQTEPSHSWFSPTFHQDNWCLTASSEKANERRNREHVVLDLFSNLKCVRSKGFFGKPLGPSENSSWVIFFGKLNWR